MLVFLENEKCKRCGLCQAICPEVFSRSGSGRSRLRHRTVPQAGDTEEFCRYAAEECPAGAIKVDNEDTLAAPPEPARVATESEHKDAA